MSTTKVKCAECGNMFEKRTADYNWTERNKLRHFCSRSCSVKCGNKEMSPERRLMSGNKIKKFCNNRKDEYSPFKVFLLKGKFSMKKHKNELDVSYLKELWDKQKGICPYTEIKMILPETTNKNWKIHSPKKASLDRIDSSKDYMRDNVEFVCYSINLAKNSFTREEMKEFFKEIKNAGNVSGI